MIFSTNKNDRRDITKILLNVALNDNNNLKKNQHCLILGKVYQACGNLFY